MKTYKKLAAIVACALFMVSAVAVPANINDNFKTSIDKTKIKRPGQGE